MTENLDTTQYVIIEFYCMNYPTTTLPSYFLPKLVKVINVEVCVDDVTTGKFSLYFVLLGGYTQTFLRQILKIFVTLGLDILRFYRPKVFFKANISKV